MRTFKLIIPFVIFLTCISFVSSGSILVLSGPGFKKNSVTSDTSEVDRLTYLALSSNIPKKKRVQYMKAYIDSAELICKKKNIEINALLHLARSEYFFITSDLNNATLEASIALKLANNSGDYVIVTKALAFLGRYSLRTGYFNESIDYLSQSIEVARKHNIKGFIPWNYSGISDVYAAIMDFKKYHNTLQSMIDEALAENDTSSIKSAYFKLGTSLTTHERDFKRSDSLLRICLELSVLTSDTSFISLSLSNLGWNFYNEKDYSSALKYYTRSLSYSIPAKKYKFSANSLGNIGTIYRDMDETEKSLNYYLKSIEQGKLGDDVYNLSWVYADMSEMYLRKKDTANAYNSFVLFKKYSDLLMKSKNSQGLNDATIRFNADTNRKELELLSLRVSKQRLLIYGYTGLFLLSITIGILLLSRAKINAKRRISEMNRKISEITQANLRQQMNPHFIFNTLNSIQYYMYQHDKLATNNYMTKFSSLMRKVLENSQHTAVPISDELDALNLYLELEKIRFKDKFDYFINIDDDIDTLLYKVPTMLIQPYVENSICHGLMPSDSNGIVKINMKLEKEYISCIIEDNGIGREAAHLKKNSCGKNHNSLGTQIISSRLDLVNTLYGTSLKTIYTDLKNENGEPEGTRVEIHIPILS
jgi:tetratricopeptide (TPR) repeat protein